MSAAVRVHRWWTLLVLCLAVFTIMVSTMVVNILIPTLIVELEASTGELLWIVDAYNLVFAALVLAGGSLSDRFGRKGALMTGLAIFIVGSLGCALAPNPEVLIFWRAIAGMGAAVIFPTTLSIISNVFPDRAERATAISIWGAATGASVAVGPIIGGALAESSQWGAAFAFCAAVGVLTLVLAVGLVPTSRDPSTPRLDYPGLGFSVLGLGTLTYAIIEGPEHGWASNSSLALFGAALCWLAGFALWESRTPQPMLDVGLFKNMRFTAAAAAVGLGFFALFGFIFLIMQYAQNVLQWGVMEAGLRQTPVAVAVAIASLTGMPLALRFGTKAVVTGGMMMIFTCFMWVSQDTATTGYPSIVGQMVLFGLGLGMVSAPATEAIMGVVPAAKAGIGSAVNDATREVGGTLGVAVIGSIAVTVYRDELEKSAVAPAVVEAAGDSLGAAQIVAAQTGDLALAAVATDSFLSGLETACYVAAGVCLAAALLTLVFLPSHPEATVDAEEPATPAPTPPWGDSVSAVEPNGAGVAAGREPPRRPPALDDRPMPARYVLRAGDLQSSAHDIPCRGPSRSLPERGGGRPTAW